MLAFRSWMASSKPSGPGFSGRAIDAPNRIGKSSVAPNPKVKPYGGVPLNTSLESGFRSPANYPE